MQWVAAPAVDVESTRSGYNDRVDFRNGGVRTRRSKTTAKGYGLSWNFKSREDVQPILDLYNGMYGDGFIYYSDPFATDRNALPTWLSTPFLNCYDGPWRNKGSRPAVSSAASSVNGYPIESATYTVTSTDPLPEVFIPIPPGFTAHFGAHGALVSGAAQVTVRKFLSAAGGDVVAAPLLTKEQNLTNVTVPSALYSGIGISLTSASSGVIRLDGMMLQVLPDEEPAPSGRFIGGNGSSGLSFATVPSETSHSIALDRVSVAVDLIEEEAWTWR